MQRHGVIDRRQRVEVVLVGALGNFGAAVRVGDALAEGAPRELAVVALKRTEDLEVDRVGDGGLDAQDRSGLVVHLDGVAAGPVLDANAFGAALEAAGELAGEIAVRLAAEESQDVGALEVLGGVADQGRVEIGEGGRVLEEQVRCPFGLVRGPVVAHGLGLENPRVQRVEIAHDGVEGVGPVRRELLIHQALGENRVAEAREAVVVAPYPLREAGS